MCVHTPPQEYYLAIETNEIVPSATTRRGLEDIRQSKMSDKKDKYQLHVESEK